MPIPYCPSVDGSPAGAAASRSAPFRSLALGACLLLAPALAAGQNAPAYKPGFPFEIPGQTADQAAPVGSQAVAADLGLTPGFKSIIFGLRNGKLYVVKRNSGTSWAVAAGWPQQLPAHIYSSPAVGDLNSDSEPDIVVGYGSVETQNSANGGAKAFRRDGSLLWTVTTADVTPGPANGRSDPVVSTPAIGDIDGDGTMEVVFGGLDHRLYVVNGENGLSNNPAIWPKDMEDTVFSSPVLHDMDGDGKLDIVIGGDRYLVNGGRLSVLRYDGTSLPGFPKDFDQVISSSPAVGDIDGDGRPEIVHGTGSFWTDANNGSNPAPLHRVYAWKCDGSAVPGWPVDTAGQVISSPALANLDGDPQPEVIVTDDNSAPSTAFHLYAFNGNGSQVFAPVVVKDFFGQNLSAGEPVVADVLGADASPEILVPTNGEVAIFSSAGAQLTETDNFPDDPAKPNLMTQDSLSGVAVTDLETDGAGSQIEVIAVSARDFPSQTITVVHVWNPIPRTSTPPWGFFHQSPDRRGVVPGTPSCGLAAACLPSTAATSFFTLAPCRAMDTRSANGPLGGPVLATGAPRTFNIGPACGVPSSAKAVSINISVTQPSGSGYVRLAPGGCTTLPIGVINFSAAQTRSNNAVLPLAVDGSGGLTATAQVGSSGTVHLIIDVNGYFQ